MRNVLVRVYNGDGTSAKGVRVSLWIYQFLASGSKEGYTNSDGEVEFDLDIDSGAEISISVEGTEYIRRGAVRGSYRIQL
ncbi:hypothetical protein [Armatimonas sp.]|uniref:hypothetical protein n=1 Tax=Armatimonas sp. TaxID=1872638 RepID=UPI0037519DAF